MPKRSSEASKKNKLIKAGASDKSIVKQIDMNKFTKQSPVVRKHTKK